MSDPELARALEDARKVPTLAGGACLPWWRDGTVTQQHGLPGVVPALIDNSGRDVCEIDGAKDPAERQAQEEFVLFASHALPNIATHLLSQAAEVERLKKDAVYPETYRHPGERAQLCEHVNEQEAKIEALAERVRLLEGALEFYADPESYFGISIFADRPCGEFAEDFSETGTELGVRHGKRARAVLSATKEG